MTTCQMKDGLEPKTESSNLERVLCLHTVSEHPNTLPVVFSKFGIVIDGKGWCLYKKKFMSIGNNIYTISCYEWGGEPRSIRY